MNGIVLYVPKSPLNFIQALFHIYTGILFCYECTFVVYYFIFISLAAVTCTGRVLGEFPGHSHVNLYVVHSHTYCHILVARHGI